MRSSGTAKFPNSVQLFKFCQRVLVHQRGDKIHDQDVGSILNFNPSDCSHWKRGEKHVKSVFALAKLAEALQVEIALIHDVANGATKVEEAFFEYSEAKAFSKSVERAQACGIKAMTEVREKVERFVHDLQKQADFSTPPLYLPEILRFFPFISAQPADMIDKLSRILKVKKGQYCIKFAKGDLRPQTRMSIVKDLAKILFEGERARFPQLGDRHPELHDFEELVFIAELLTPKAMLLEELGKIDSRKNIIWELATAFWAPKTLVGFQMQDILRSGVQVTKPAAKIPQDDQPSVNP